MKPDGTSEGSLGDPARRRGRRRRQPRSSSRAQSSEIRSLPGDVRAFVEVLEPPLRLLICGAGHDAVPLVKAAAVLGWSPVVVDDRPGFLTEERYPEASGFVLVEEPEDAAKVAATDERTFVVVMTHNFLRDKAYLRSFLASPVAYIGMLGPAARTHRLLMELADEGVEVSDEDRARIHGPAGLDLGSEGPEEIAGSILSEIVAVRRGRHGGFLKERPGPIHDRPRPGPRRASTRIVSESPPEPQQQEHGEGPDPHMVGDGFGHLDPQPPSALGSVAGEIQPREQHAVADACHDPNGDADHDDHAKDADEPEPLTPSAAHEHAVALPRGLEPLVARG